MSKKIAIIGVGNLLMGDDGIGIHALEALRHEALPSDVAVFSAETRAFDALEYMDGCDKAVIVDAYRKGGAPGNIYRFAFDPAGKIDESMNLSMHDINFIDALRAGRDVYKLPAEIVIIGIEPEILECKLGLSSKLNNAIPEIIEAVKSEMF
ncbi:MAG: hydrogenase maturation protease [Candidatus Methanoperedens sp.]